VEKFIHQYNDRIFGVIFCFDRILFKGYLPIGWADAMERLLIKDFKQFVMKHSECIKDHAEAIALKHQRPDPQGRSGPGLVSDGQRRGEHAALP